jgi:NADH-quinone oxidoreductase subunit H
MLIIIIEILSKILSMVVPLLISIAYLTLGERKVIAAIQRRKGPNSVGVFGLLQPIADGVKLFFKETIVPKEANLVLFIGAPIFTFTLSLVSWCIIPFDDGRPLVDINVGMLYIFAVSSLGVYGTIIAGWSSNSKYAFLGSLRSAAQMISYEVSIGVIIMTVIISSGSLNLTYIVEKQSNVWYVNSLLPLFIMFFISCLAETNRAPFDLPEAEAELVAGYNVEYSSMGFALFFLGEYGNMILMSAVISLLFLGGWLPIHSILEGLLPGSFWLGLKICLCLFFL